MKHFCFLLISVVCCIQQSLGCDGYTVNITSMTPCAKDNIVTYSEDFQVVLDEDCYLNFIGCVNITEDLETTKINLTVNKPPLPTLADAFDLCKPPSRYGESLKTFGIEKCPIEKMYICGTPDKKYDIKKYRDKLRIAQGHTRVILEADHGEVGKTCIKIEIDINKPRKKTK